MKHIRTLTQTPARAQEVTVGQILTFVVSLLSVVATFLTAKEQI